MKQPNRILIVEDKAVDADLAKRTIQKVLNDCEFQVVETREDFLTALQIFQPEVILSDYSLPRFDGMKALRLGLNHAPLTPLIIWTGSISEDVAVECMKAGANNYVLKENIKRLAPAVIHALEERQLLLERKQAEEIIQNNEKRFRALIENGMDNISLLRVDGTLIWESPTATSMLSYAPNEFVGRDIFSLMHPDDLGWTRDLYTKLIHEPGDHQRGTFRLRRSDGTWRWVDAIVTNMLKEPSVNAIVVNYRDVTERKLAEESLQASETRFRTFVDHATDAFFLHDEHGMILDVNHQACESLGYSHEELVKLTPLDFDVDLDRKSLRQLGTRLKAGETIAFDTRYRRKDGTIFPVEVRIRAFHEGEHKLAISLVRDITDRKHTEERLRLSENRYRMATKATNDIIWEWHPKTNQLIWSENAQDVFGYSLEEIGPNDKWWDNHIHPEDRERVILKLSTLLDGTESIWQEEYRFLLKNGSYAHISDHGYIEREVGGKPLRMTGAMSDITSRKAAEVERQALFEIMQGITHTSDLQELLKLIHRSIAKVIYARNFFVVLYNEKDRLFEEIYSVDQYDPPASPSRLEKSITSYVFHSGEPLLLTKQSFHELAEQGVVELVGTDSDSWLGVPIKTSGITIGVIAVQDYENSDRYSERDLEFLVSIASQIALAINHRQATEAVRESEIRYRGLFENLVIGFALHEIVVDVNNQPIDYVFLEINPAFEKLTGIRADQAVGKRLKEILPGVENDRFIQIYGQVALTGIPVHFEEFSESLGKYYEINAYSPKHGQFAVTFADITQRKQAEKTLHESVALYRKAMEVAGAVPYYESYYDEGRLIKYEFIGEGIRQITGYGPEEFNATLWDSLVEEVVLVEDLAGYSLEDGIERVRAGENSIWKCEHRLRDRDGKIHWVFEAAVELRDENGISHGSIGTYQDITARKLAVEAEHEQRTLAEALRDTAETLSSSLSYEEVLDRILDAVGRVVPHDAATIMLIEGESAHVVRSYGYDNRGFDIEIMGIELRLAETHNLREMIETRQPVIVSDTYSYPDWKRLEATDWLRSNVGAPISIQDQVIGFILLDGQTPGFFTPVHAERLEAFANQAAIAIHNAHLLQQAQDEIEERKRAEESLQAEREKAQKYLDIAGVMMLALDQDGFVTLINQKGCEILGYSADEIVGKNWIATFLPKSIRTDLQGTFQQLISGERQSAGYYENSVLTKNGEERLIAWHNIVVQDKQGTIVNTLSSGEDITERKLAESQLRASEERFRQLADNIQEAFWMTDAESGAEIYMSPASEAIWERPIEVLMDEPKAFINSVFPADKFIVLQAIEKEKAGERVDIEYRIIRPNGSIRWVWDRAFPIFDDAGKVKRIAGISADITERRESEIALIKSQSRYRELFDSSPVSIWEEDYSLVKKQMDLLAESGVADLQSYLSGHPEEVSRLASLVMITDVNKASLELYRLEHKEALLINLGELLNEEAIGHFQDEILGLISPVKRFQWEGTDKRFDGKQIEVIVSGSISRGYEEDWSKVIVSIIDITERRQAEQQLRKLSRAVEHSASTILITDTTGNIEYVNPKFTEVTGYSFEEAADQNPRILKSGLTSRGVYQHLWQTINSGKEWRGELQNRKKNGELFWEYATISPVLNEQGEITHFVGVKEDITQRKEDELEIGRHMAELEALYECGLAIGQLLIPKEIGNRLINTFTHYLSWHHVTIRLRKEDSHELELIAFNLPFLKDEERVETERKFTALINKVGHGLSGLVIQTGTPLRTGNVHANPQYIDTYPDIQSGLYMPLTVGERVIGVISVESEIADAFTEHDERLLATLSNQAAIAFENARLYETIQRELVERKRAEQDLRVSEIHYRELADSITDILFELDQDLRFTHWNKASEFFLGTPAKDVIGKSMHQVFGDSEEQSTREKIYKSVLRDQRAGTFETEVFVKGQKRALEINVYPSARGVSVVAKDVTERKRSEIIIQKRLKLMEYAFHHSLDEVMRKTIDEISELTESHIGFLHFFEADEKTINLQTWSTETLERFCQFEAEEVHYPLDQAGIWADAIRQRISVVHNDYESVADKSGLPEGHAQVIREMVIPIIRNEKVKTLIGVGNKAEEYTENDIEVTQRFADYAWDIIERKQMELALEAERKQLAQRVDERTADLSRANSNLARALRVKDEFLANMSHELRTPLNAILGLSESLSEQTAGPLNEKQQKYIATISESGHHLLSLINDILDLAKIDAGQITLDINKVDVRSVCQASLRMIKQLAQKKHQEVALEIDSHIGLMWADERRLKQMLVNLLGNAVKFTPENGKLGLEVHGDQEANKISFTVWDRGIGIKEEDLIRLFQPFVQLDSGLARETTGTGLGLALVAQMARLHGGSIQALSEPENGSRFSVVLPWEPAVAMDADARMKITGKFRAIQLNEKNKPTILLVEDTQEVTMMIKDYLELAGYKVVTAQDGVDAIVQAKLIRPDLILMDVQMPRMDGMEATRKLRSEPNFRYTPIIALTALAMPNDRERCLEAGMDEYISKPVNLKALIMIIQNCLLNAKEVKLQ